MEPRTNPDVPAVRPEHRPLFKYLRDRFAHRVVLTFGQIEDLLNDRLPDSARVQADWWTGLATDTAVSPQAAAWLHANRTAVPDLSAGTVMFERNLD